METIKISRYSAFEDAISELDRLEDALDLLSFLKAEDYVASQLQDSHSKNTSTARKLAKRISAHAGMADQYARLSLVAPETTSFLPGYYSILNLAKCVSLCGAYHEEFNKNAQWHGATHNPKKKQSHSILTDEVRVRGGGALALFYQTITGTRISSDHYFMMRDIYCLIREVSSELVIANGTAKIPWLISFSAIDVSGGVRVVATVIGFDGAEFPGTVRTVPPLKGFKKIPKKSGVFEKTFSATSGFTLAEEIRSCISPEFLIYHNEHNTSAFIEQKPSLPLPEEFSIALAFFHLSSVCRYNPEFMEKLSTSKEWPMMLALKRQGLYRFILSVWSYFIQRNYVLS